MSTPLSAQDLAGFRLLREDVRRQYEAEKQGSPNGRYAVIADYYRLGQLLDQCSTLQQEVENSQKVMALLESTIERYMEDCDTANEEQRTYYRSLIGCLVQFQEKAEALLK
jgi:hypothetical protein